MRYLFSFYLLLFSLAGCHSQPQTTQNGRKIFTAFPAKKKVAFQQLMVYNQGIIRRIFIKDSLLIIANPKGASNYLFSMYSLNNRKHIHDLVPLGGRHGQVLGSISMGQNGNSLWAYDISANKIVDMDLSVPDTTKNIKEFKLTDFYYSVQPLDSNRWFGNGNAHLTKKIQLLDLSAQKIVSEYGDYLDLPSGVPIQAWRKANESFLIIKPDGTKIVNALRYSDQIQVLDIKTRDIKIIQGPDVFDIFFKAFKMPDGSDMSERTELTRFAFSSGVASNKHIYLLYSGNNHMDKNLNYGKKIYVYSWDGTPVKILTLPGYISCFDILEDRILYAYDIESKSVVTAKIN